MAARCSQEALKPLLRPDLPQILEDDETYRAFLTHSQGLALDLVSAPSALPPEPEEAPPQIQSEEADEAAYTAQVEQAAEVDLAAPDISGASRRVPREQAAGQTHRADKDPRLGRAALQRSGYRCQCGREHTTFVSAVTGEMYLEAHHLIPIRFQQEMWEKFGVNIDCVENLVALCPNCHRAVHYGTRKEKKQRLKALYEEKKKELRQAGLDLTWLQLKELYGLD